MIILAEEKRPAEIKSLKPGSFVLIDDIPCKVESVQTSKPGKHGSAKARMVATGIFENTKKNIVKPADETIYTPIIEKRNMQVLAFVGENAQLMDMEDYSQIEVPVPEEFKGKLSEGDEILVWRYGKYALIKGKK